MNPPNTKLRSSTFKLSRPELLLDFQSIANAEIKLLADPYSALCDLKANVTMNYIEATNLIPSEQNIRSMMREALCRDIPDPLATIAASELLAEIFWQMRTDLSSVSETLAQSR